MQDPKKADKGLKSASKKSVGDPFIESESGCRLLCECGSGLGPEKFSFF
jgi:hypothetical protein